MSGYAIVWANDNMPCPRRQAACSMCHTIDVGGGDSMKEILLAIRIEVLPEGGFLATSEELPGLVAQGRTMAETLEIAQDGGSQAYRVLS